MRDKWIDFISKTENYRPFHDEAMRLIKKWTGSYKNCCATKASTFLKYAGILDKQYAMTNQVEHALLKLGAIRINSIDDLRKGDICFSQDLNGNGFPDHVYILMSDAISSLKNRNATILDNYSVSPAIRNLGPGAKTPFAFALRLPEPSSLNVKPLNLFFSNLVEMFDNIEQIGLSTKEKNLILSKMNDIRNSDSIKGLKR